MARLFARCARCVCVFARACQRVCDSFHGHNTNALVSILKISMCYQYFQYASTFGTNFIHRQLVAVANHAAQPSALPVFTSGNKHTQALHAFMVRSTNRRT